MKSVYDFETAISEIMDEALNKLSPKEFGILKDSVSIILASYE